MGTFHNSNKRSNGVYSWNNNIQKQKNHENLSTKLLGFVLAGVWMVAAYYLAGAVITRFIMLESATLNQALLIALKDIPSNIAQAVVGIVIALPLGKALKNQV